MKIELEGPF